MAYIKKENKKLKRQNKIEGKIDIRKFMFFQSWKSKCVK